MSRKDNQVDKEYNQKYYEENKEQLKEYKKKYYEEHKDEYSERDKKNPRKSVVLSIPEDVYNLLKQRADSENSKLATIIRKAITEYLIK